SCVRSPSAVPWVIGLLTVVRQSIKGEIELVGIPDPTGVDDLGPRHAAVFDHLVELPGADADVDCRLLARQPATGLRRSPQLAGWRKGAMGIHGRGTACRSSIVGRSATFWPLPSLADRTHRCGSILGNTLLVAYHRMMSPML